MIHNVAILTALISLASANDSSPKKNSIRGAKGDRDLQAGFNVGIPDTSNGGLPGGINLPGLPEGFNPSQGLPEGFTLPPGINIPDGFDPTQGIPEGFTLPPGVNLPDAFDPSQNIPGYDPANPLPAGFTLPPGINIPENFDPSQGLPEGFELPNGMTIPPDYTLPPQFIQNVNDALNNPNLVQDVTNALNNPDVQQDLSDAALELANNAQEFLENYDVSEGSTLPPGFVLPEGVTLPPGVTIGTLSPGVQGQISDALDNAADTLADLTDGSKTLPPRPDITFAGGTLSPLPDGVTYPPGLPKPEGGTFAPDATNPFAGGTLAPDFEFPNIIEKTLPPGMSLPPGTTLPPAVSEILQDTDSCTTMSLVNATLLANAMPDEANGMTCMENNFRELGKSQTKAKISGMLDGVFNGFIQFHVGTPVEQGIASAKWKGLTCSLGATCTVNNRGAGAISYTGAVTYKRWCPTGDLMPCLLINFGTTLDRRKFYARKTESGAWLSMVMKGNEYSEVNLLIEAAAN